MLERVWRKGNPLTLLVGIQASTAIMENSVEILYKIGNRSLIWPSNPTAGIHTKETRIERETCTPIFIAALFIIARTWKQPRCPSADEWIRKPWYIYTIEYYSTVKKNTFEWVLLRWMNMEPIIQSEVSQKEKHLYSISSVQLSRSVVSNSLRPHEAHHARPPCPSPTPGVHPDSRPLSQWCHPAISSSVIPFSSCPQSLPASEYFPMSQHVTWGGQSTGVSALASFLPKKSQGWSPSEWTGWISLQPKGLSRVFSNTTVQKHLFFSTQFSSESNSHIHTWPQEKP